jgi:4-amino-4-deoxychorismate lyase
MSLFFESICVKDGKFELLDLHEERMQRARKERLGIDEPLRLNGIVAPDWTRNGKFKCRVAYDREIESVTFEEYVPTVYERFRLVDADRAEYAHKFTDRTQLLSLLEEIAPDGLIIVKDGLITDSYHANLAFFDGEMWSTPSEPLLRGCMREWLIRTGQVTPASIRPSDLDRYTHFKQINSMLGFEDSPTMEIGKILR